MDTTAAQNTSDGYTLNESGQYTFNTKCKVRYSPDMNADGVATVNSGDTFNYDGKEKYGDHFWLFQNQSSGMTEYVPYANITKGTYFGTDSNSDDPIQSSSTGTGSGSDTGTGSGSGSGDTGSGSTTTSTDPDAPGAKFQLLNLPIDNANISGPQAVQKCFTVFDNTAYVIQIDQSKAAEDSNNPNNVYLARGTVDQDAGTVTFESDYMTLQGFGHCQTLDYYQYNNQVYLWIALDGRKTDNGNYWGTQLGRIQYTPGQTISSYTEVTRLANLISANSTGTDVGTLKRVETAVSEDWNSMVVMDITTDNQVYLTYYDFMELNGLMDNHEGTYLSCKDITSLAHDWGSSASLSSLLPQSMSVQGLAMDADHNVYVSSGQAGLNKANTDPAKDGAWLAKAAWGGTFAQQAIASSSESSSDWSGKDSIVEVEGIQLYYGNVNVTVTKHLSPDKSYIYQFPETQF
ncbi:class III bacteriocin [Lentilactobacillus hilgardii]|nr:class III bacteriocin [Lentilactobacillus hilgardii]MCV3741241.1 class III bacteriocin [Lentilactobacillus hilgardii]